MLPYATPADAECRTTSQATLATEVRGGAGPSLASPRPPMPQLGQPGPGPRHPLFHQFYQLKSMKGQG